MLHYTEYGLSLGLLKWIDAEEKSSASDNLWKLASRQLKCSSKIVWKNSFKGILWKCWLQCRGLHCELTNVILKLIAQWSVCKKLTRPYSVGICCSQWIWQRQSLAAMYHQVVFKWKQCLCYLIYVRSRRMSNTVVRDTKQSMWGCSRKNTWVHWGVSSRPLQLKCTDLRGGVSDAERWDREQNPHLL